ncbi:hypothetical protein HYU18_03620 [Candidatus Woesearchaeota archaeon]|nr:hypothetical protein [Candidatus Woesearchaeota archaeon]
MEWFEELGFTENPFDTDAAFSAQYSAGLESQLEELNYLVNSGSFVFVEGEPGSGKSVLLRMLAGKFGGRVLSVDAAIDGNIRSAVKSRVSVFGYLLGRSPRNLVALVDNAQSLSPDGFEFIKYGFDNNQFSAVVLAGSALKGIPDSILDRVGNRVVKVPFLTEEAALLMVKRRLGSSQLLEDDSVRKLYRKSGRNAKKFLQLCEEAAKSLSAEVDVNG